MEERVWGIGAEGNYLITGYTIYDTVTVLRNWLEFAAAEARRRLIRVIWKR